MSHLRKYIFVIVLLLTNLSAGAQVHVARHRLSSEDRLGRMCIFVMDSASRSHLPGAVVYVVDGRDTIKSITDDIGQVVMRTDFKSDTITVSSSFIGFKRIEGKVECPKNSFTELSVSIFLPENPLELNSIIVEGDAVAMVMHGDTTVFNSAAFNTMDGDMLRDFLRRLPGVEVSQNGLTYNGKSIDRILFNGQNLFGKEMADAMDMVLADEVHDIKVYSKKAVDDLGLDSSERKEYVMDVKTKKPLERVGQLKLGAMAGLYTTKKENDKFESLGSVSAAVGDYTLKPRPYYNVDFSAQHNGFDLYPYAYNSPVNRMETRIALGKDVMGKGGYRHMLTFKSDRTSSRASDKKIFLPADAWTQRSDSIGTLSKRTNRSLSYIASAYFKKNGNSVWLDGNFTLNQDFTRNRNASSSRQDDLWTGYDKIIRDTSKTIKFSAGATFAHKFAGSGHLIKAGAKIQGTFDNGSGGRIDTLSNSMSREWLCNSAVSRSVSPSMSLSWQMAIGTDRKSTILLGVMPSYVYKYARNIYTNILSGTVDMNNSFDYTDNYLKNLAFAGYKHGRENDGFFVDLQAGVANIVNDRNEHLDNVDNLTQNYVRPDLRGRISYVRGVNQFMVDYREKENVPSARQLRETLNDANPLFLSQGNPSLRLPVDRNLDLSFGHSFSEKNSVLTIKANGEFNAHAIASKTEYFSTDTYLEKYGYEAKSGSALVTPENITGKYSLTANIEYDKFISDVDSRLNFSLGYNTVSNPYYIGNEFCKNIDNVLNAGSSFSYFGQKMTMVLSPALSVGRSLCNGERLYDFLSLSIQASYEQRIGKRFGLRMSPSAEIYRTTEAALRYDNIDLNCELSWFLGKESRSCFSLYGSNLINSLDEKKVKVFTNYTSKSFNSMLGRAFGVSIIFFFTKR